MLPVILIAAVADNGVIGRAGGLAFKQGSDLKRFRALTMGKPLVMGRRTHESIGGPLPGRETVVVTRDRDLAGDPSGRVHVAFSLDEALGVAQARARAMGADAVLVAGGAEVYASAIDVADRLHLTEVHAAPEGDTHFPAFDRSRFHETARQRFPSGDGDEHPYSFVDYERLR